MFLVLVFLQDIGEERAVGRRCAIILAPLVFCRLWQDDSTLAIRGEDFEIDQFVFSCISAQLSNGIECLTAEAAVFGKVDIEEGVQVFFLDPF